MQTSHKILATQINFYVENGWVLGKMMRKISSAIHTKY